MDLFDKFIEKYEQGHWSEALEKIIPNPNVEYEALRSENPYFSFLANLADACFYKGAVSFNHTSKVMLEIIRFMKNKALYESFAQSLTYDEEINSLLYGDPQRIKDDKNIPEGFKQFFIELKNGYLLHETAIHENLKYLPNRYHNLFSKKLQVYKGWMLLQKNRTEFCGTINDQPWEYFIPWIQYTYPLKVLKPEASDKNKIPLIFLEPLRDCDYEAFFKPYLKGKMILAVETIFHLFQMLQFSYIHQLLNDTNVYLYVMESFPQEQFKAQGFSSNGVDEVQLIFMAKHQVLEQFASALSAAFNLFLKEPEASEQLYIVARNALFNDAAKRYGKSRSIALSVEEGIQNWFSAHKILSSDVEIDKPSRIDYLSELIEEQAKARNTRPFKPEQKVRITHVVPQIVDGGHAPTKLLNILCKNAERAWFDISVICTERVVDHLLSYPTPAYSSESSFIRGAKTIEDFNKSNIKLFIEEVPPTYEMSVDRIKIALAQLKTDIVVFHGPDEINLLVSAGCDVPIRIFFDHGTLPAYGCFDLAILSTEESYQLNHERFRQLGMESCYLPYSIDMRKDWQEKLVSKTEMDIPEDAFVLTTISMHLDNRLSPQVCEAIAQVLKRCPAAFYAPMGIMKNLSKPMEIFKKHGVEKRVKFLGPVNCPSHLARSMKLYMNEFPFGSGLGILDAMASGCPVVSMYDENGPQQGRYAGTYFGLDHVIRSGKVEDYIDLACKLIQDPEMYREWSNHALIQYEKRIDTKQYVKNIELIIEHFIQFKTKGSVA